MRDMTTTQRTAQPPTSPRDLINACGNTQSLANVFGWLDDLFGAIGRLGGDESVPQGVRLMRMKSLADMGQYLVTDWRGIADNMAEELARKTAPESADAGVAHE
jgi:hypothetical protein